VTEAQEQAKVIAWCNAQPEPVPYIVARNETSRGGRWRKWEGNLKGIPDVFIPLMSDGFGGLFIEMKQEGGRMSPEQEKWINRLNHAGYYATTCWSAEDAIRTIEDYLACQL
jgi:hypothetical protein